MAGAMRDFLTYVERDGALQETECFLGALIGGLFGMADAKKRDKAAAKAAKVPVISNTSHEVDLKGLNAAAIAAGYNPMTILNAGGLSAFTKTRTETTGQNAMAAVPTAPSFGSVFANALNSTVQSVASYASAGAGAGALSASSFLPAAVPSVASVMRATPAGGSTGGAGGLQFGAASTLTAKKGGMPVVPSIEQPTLTNPHPNAAIDPITRDASAYEERYGDVAGSAAGVWILYQDALRNLTGLNQNERHMKYREYYEAAKTGVLSGAQTVVGGVRNAAESLGVTEAKAAEWRAWGVVQPPAKAGGGGW